MNEVEGMELLIRKFLRARSEKSINKYYHYMENQYGYALLSGDNELANTIRAMINEALKLKNFM